MHSSSDEAREAVGLFEERYGALPLGGGATELADLLQCFAFLPYENLTKILAWQGGRSAPAESVRGPRTVMNDHLRWGTGGTCFSLTELLRLLAHTAGFHCHPVMAHMRHGENIHCALRVEVSSATYLVDPGYLVRRPLRFPERPALIPAELGQAFLAPVGSIPVPDEVRRLDGELDLFTLEPEGPRWRYRVCARCPSTEEFRAHWLRSFDQPAMRSLLVTRRSERDELLYLHNHKLRFQRGEEKHTTNVRAELESSVSEIFGIDPEVTRRAKELIQSQRLSWRRARDEHHGRP